MVVGGAAAAPIKLKLHGVFGAHGVKTAAHSTLATQCRSFFGNDIDCVTTYPQTMQQVNVNRESLYKKRFGRASPSSRFATTLDDKRIRMRKSESKRFLRWGSL